MKAINFIIKSSVKHSIITIAIVIAITIIIIPGMLKIQLDNNIKGFLGSNFRVVMETNYIEQSFNIPKSTFFVAVESDNIYTTKALEYVNLLHSQFSAKIEDINAITIKGTTYHKTDKNFNNYLLNKDIESITINGIIHKKPKAIINKLIRDVESIITAIDVTKEEETLDTFDFIKEKDGKRVIPTTKEELNELKEQLEDNKYYEGLYYSIINPPKELDQKQFEEKILNNIKPDDDKKFLLKQYKKDEYKKYNLIEPINKNDRRTLIDIFKKCGYIINPKAWIMSVEIDEKNLSQFYDVIDYVEELIDITKDSGFKVKMFGVDYTNRSMNEESQNDAKNQILIVVVVIMFVFFLNFKKPAGVILPELNTILSVLWVFGIMGYFGVKFSIVGLLILPVLFAVTSSYSIHSLNQYYKNLPNYKEGESKSKQIADSMSHILKTIIVAGLTTFVSLVSLITCNIIHIQTFGIFSGIGVLISVSLSLTFIPAVLSMLPKAKKELIKHKEFNNTFLDKVIRKTVCFMIKHRKPLFVSLLALGIIFISGICLINTDSSFVTMFSEDHKIRKLSEYFSETIGGVTTLNITIDANSKLDNSLEKGLNEYKKQINQGTKPTEKNSTTKIDETSTTPIINKDDPFASPFDDETNANEDPFASPFDDETNANDDDIEIQKEFGKSNKNFALNPKFLKEILALSEYCESIEGVGRVYSYADIVKRFHYVFNNKDPQYKVIPENEDLIIQYNDMFYEGSNDTDNNGVADNIEIFVEPNYNKLNIIVTLQDKGKIPINTGDYERIEIAIRDYIDTHFKDFDIDYYLTGWAMLHEFVQKEIVIGQIMNIITSIFLIFLIAAILFRSIITGLVSIIPLSASILITLGLMGYLGIPLDIATALISALAIGISVDDTVHYMLHLKTFKDEMGADVEIEPLIYKTSCYTSKAIIFTSIALIAGFLVVLFSTFIPIRQFAFLTAFTLFVATVATLWALPSILLIFPRIVGVKKKLGKDFKVDPDKVYF